MTVKLSDITLIRCELELSIQCSSSLILCFVLFEKAFVEAENKNSQAKKMFLSALKDNRIFFPQNCCLNVIQAI